MLVITMQSFVRSAMNGMAPRVLLIVTTAGIGQSAPLINGRRVTSNTDSKLIDLNHPPQALGIFGSWGLFRFIEIVYVQGFALTTLYPRHLMCLAEPVEASWSKQINCSDSTPTKPTNYDKQ